MMSVVKKLKLWEYSDDRKRAIREAEKRRLRLALIGSEQKSLKQFEGLDK